MSNKKKMQDSSIVVDIAETETVVEDKGRIKKDRAGAVGAGFCVYIGPTILGVIQSGTVYQGSREQVLARAEMAEALTKYPLIAGLLVAGSRLPEARLKVKAPGNLLYINYQKLVQSAGRQDK